MKWTSVPYETQQDD